MLHHACTSTAPSSVSTRFQRDGYFFAPSLLPGALVEQAVRRMDAVMAGDYQTGVAPLISDNGTSATRLVKIDQVQRTDPVLRAVCTHPAIGQWAARITGAKWIQLWAVQMLFKPPGGTDDGAIGFHQDRWYWRYWSESSEVFTAWVALSDITPDCGPMNFVSQSHTRGTLAQPDEFAFAGGRTLRAQHILGLPTATAITEIPALMPAGAVSFHHRLMLHGSGANQSPLPRRALALHLRTEHSQPEPAASEYYVSHLDDPEYCPVLYDDRAGTQTRAAMDVEEP